MIPFNIKQLETFLWVATLGSFRKAAERLNTTQPAISSRIAGLEEALGVKLFERHSSSVRLTAKGHQLLPAAKRVLRMADKLQMAAHPDAGTGGVLRLGVSETIVQTWLPDFLREFQVDFPLIETDLLVDATTNLRNELISQRIDLAVLMGPVLEFRIENVGMPPVPLVWVCAPQLKLANTSKLTLCQLTQFPIISYGRTTRPYSEIYRKLSSEFDEPPRVFPANSLAASIKMTLDGIGIASLPRDLVGDHVAEGKLLIVDCDWHPSDLLFTASYAMEPTNPVAEHAAELALRTAKAYAVRNDNAVVKSPADGFARLLRDYAGR
ncbi:LysR family transcriptional regulator [Mesorhizobium tianshanense]|uniref:DNA-binding transcriptional LysR family regulator n=1 Tax=Mesorhizobium tianshanense TaxID=39844 RepID=A0A562PCB2_9HYPH|nr:LysR family transcriptional regulator [Mesorhizobium tianshanense]TWI41973.1 DNA-binding transcriptional LysR family regulator [Mesorhizobium tianshanense]GLS34701.1 LysR family transcriptional regulator [Mesorhizobium tianshanense]